MSITHTAVKASGDVGLAEEWNAEHTVTDPNIVKRSTTLIVAANDSKDKTRADYVCDGSADQVQINTAITDLPATGGQVLLLDGLYKTSGTINVNKSNVTLIGMGKSTIIETETDDMADPLISVSDVLGIKISSIYLRKGATLEDIPAILMADVIDSTIENCWTADVTDGHIKIWTGSTRVNVINNHISGPTGHVMIYNSPNVIVLGNVIDTEEGASSIYIYGNTDNCVVMSNRIVGVEATTGIRIDNVNCEKNLVVGNNCAGCGTAVTDLGTNSEVAHNTN